MSWEICYVLDALVILSFIGSYYLFGYRRGYKIDFWYTTLFMMCILPNAIMLPFARSELNAFVLQKDFMSVVAVVPQIFLLSVLGYVSVLAGGSLWRFRLGIGLRKTAMKVLDIVPASSRMLMASKSILVFQAYLCIIFQVLILMVYFSRSGFGFNLRDFTFAHPELRPIALLVSNYSVVIASHCFARYLDTREKSLLMCTYLLSFGLIFFGARALYLSIFLNISICQLIKMRGKVKLFRLFFIIFLVLMVALYMGHVRSGSYSVAQFLSTVLFLIFYGNNFSDLRDFAWVYAKWDHVLWMGKTYLAGITSFVPRFASKFRDTWGLGVATDLTTGLDPQTHPGLRPGTFGEGYLNFGLLGIILVGLTMGVILRRVDIDTKRALSGPRPSMSTAYASTMMLSIVGAVAVSVNINSIYILMAIYLFSWVCLGIQKLVLWRGLPAVAE
jgi:oligosaccharide repeat unit polymerase